MLTGKLAGLQAEQAEIAALNEAERRDLDGPSPDAAEDENDALLALPVMRAVSMLNACRRVENYERINMISQGTYGIVYRCAGQATPPIMSSCTCSVVARADRCLHAMRDRCTPLCVSAPCSTLTAAITGQAAGHASRHASGLTSQPSLHSRQILTGGCLYRAKEKSTGVECALKKVKISKERDRDGFPLTALREVNVLLSLYHPAIVNVTEVVVGTSLDSVYMVMEFMDHELKALMEEMQQPFSTAEVQWLSLLLRQYFDDVRMAACPSDMLRRLSFGSGSNADLLLKLALSLITCKLPQQICSMHFAQAYRDIIGSGALHALSPYVVLLARFVLCRMEDMLSTSDDSEACGAVGQVPVQAAAGGGAAPARQLGHPPRSEDQQHPVQQRRRAQALRFRPGQAVRLASQSVHPQCRDTVLPRARAAAR